MADKHIHVNTNHNQQEIRNFSLEKLAADPTGAGLYADRLWFNTADRRIKHYDGIAVKTLAHLEDIAKRLRLLGTSPFTGGIIPVAAPVADTDGTTTIEAGDYFIASTAVVLSPAPAQGDPSVESGDMAIALVDNPATNADWAIIQVNIALPTGLVVQRSVVVPSASFVGYTGPGTTDDFTAVFPSLTDIHNVQLRNAATNEVIEMGVMYAPASNSVLLCASYDLPIDVLVTVIGTSV